MTRRRILLLTSAGAALLAVSTWFGLPYLLRTGAGEPPLNFVAATARLATSGQPSRAQFADLHAQGYTLVINLAPADSYGALADEAALVAAQGMRYLGIPVNWEMPARADFTRFSDALTAAGAEKVWVHCQINFRASAFVFLHRVIREQTAPEDALGAMHAVWVPNATWRKFMEEVLRQHGVRIEPDLLS